MEISVFVYFSICATFHCFNFNITQENSNLIDAVAEIFKSSFVVNKFSPNIISIADNELDNNVYFSNQILLNSEKLNIAVYYENINMDYKIQDRKRQLMFVVMERFSQFLKLHSDISPRTFKLNGFVVIILVKGKIPEIQEMFKFFRKLQIYNINVVFEDENGSVKVETFIPFIELKCDNTKPVIINEFKSGEFIQGTENLFTERTENLHNCPIRVATSNDSAPSILAHRFKNGTYRLNGRDIKLLITLSELIRFSINYTFIGPEGFFLSNGSSEGPFRALRDGEADISISKWWLKENRIKFFDFTSSYIIDEITFLIPPGSELTPFEKLIFPFSYHVWIGIVTLFVIGFLVIFAVKQMSKISQDFVFGTGVKTPFLNVIIGFMGGTQSVLPKTNFARTLLMMFLMYALVIRTLYQAVYYQLMQSSLKHKEVQSIDEMLAKGFTFLSLPLTADVFQGSDLITKKFESYFLSLILFIKYQYL